MYYGAANRDDAMFADADRLISPAPMPRRISPGYGPHICIGRMTAIAASRKPIARSSRASPISDRRDGYRAEQFRPGAAAGGGVYAGVTEVNQGSSTVRAASVEAPHFLPREEEGQPFDKLRANGDLRYTVESAQELVVAGSRADRRNRGGLSCRPSGTLGVSSIAVPPAATPAWCHASACAGSTAHREADRAAVAVRRGFAVDRLGDQRRYRR